MAHIPKQPLRDNPEPEAAQALQAVAEKPKSLIGAEHILLQTEADLRIEFAKIAFREIVSWQVAERKAGQEDLAADWAFRYADRMVEKSKKKPSLPSYNARGVQGIAQEPPAEITPPAELPPLVEVP